MEKQVEESFFSANSKNKKECKTRLQLEKTNPY